MYSVQPQPGSLQAHSPDRYPSLSLDHVLAEEDVQTEIHHHAVNLPEPSLDNQPHRDPDEQ